MARDVVKQLEGRERDLVMNAALQVQAALERMEQAKADGLLREQHFQALLQMAIGQEQITDLVYDVATSEVYREKPDGKPAKNGRKPRRSPTSKRPANKRPART